MLWRHWPFLVAMDTLPFLVQNAATKNMATSLTSLKDVGCLKKASRRGLEQNRPNTSQNLKRKAHGVILRIDL